MFDVVCVGNALVDVTVKVSDSFLDGLGLKKGTMSLTDDIRQKFVLSSLGGVDKVLSPGGSSGNVASGVACLGGKSAFLGKVGFDEYGSFFESSLIDKGVVPKLSRSSVSTGSAITFITAEGERTFSTYLGASSFLGKTDLLNIPESKFFHVEAYLLEDVNLRGALFSICKNLKNKGVKISFDLSDSSLIVRLGDVLADFLFLVDVVFANEAEAEAFTKKVGVDAAKALSSFCSISVVKLGEKGSIIVSNNELISLTPEVVKPVNTNGAGDAYAAGFLFGLANNYSLKDAGLVASFIAKEVVLVSSASLSKDLKNEVKKLFC